MLYPWDAGRLHPTSSPPLESTTIEILRSGEGFSAINVLLAISYYLLDKPCLSPPTQIHDTKAMFQVIANIQDHYY